MTLKRTLVVEDNAAVTHNIVSALKNLEKYLINFIRRFSRLNPLAKDSGLDSSLSRIYYSG